MFARFAGRCLSQENNRICAWNLKRHSWCNVPNMEQRYGACVQRVDGNRLCAIDCPVRLGIPRGSVGGRALVPIRDPRTQYSGWSKGRRRHRSLWYKGSNFCSMVSCPSTHLPSSRISPFPQYVSFFFQSAMAFIPESSCQSFVLECSQRSTGWKNAGNLIIFRKTRDKIKIQEKISKVSSCSDKSWKRNTVRFNLFFNTTTRQAHRKRNLARKNQNRRGSR